MRIIAGTLKGRRLAAVKGDAIRPTSDRLRETLFNIIAARVPGSRFLDLCCGSGAIGIEALSRGAAEVVLVDISRRALAVANTNVRRCRIETGIDLVQKEAAAAIRLAENKGRQFDLVYFDPPYQSPAYSTVLSALGSSPVLAPSAMVIVEHRKDQILKPLYRELQLARQVRQGDSLLSFYTKTEEAPKE